MLIGENEDVGAEVVGGVDFIEVIERVFSEEVLPNGETPATFLANLSFSRNLKLTP